MTDYNINVIVDPSNAESGTRRVQNALDKTSDSANRLRNQLAKAFSFAAAGAAIAGLTRNALQFSDAMAEVSTLVDTATFDVRLLTREVLAQSAAYGSFPAVQAKAAYAIISAGATSAAQATDILTASNKLAVGGVTSVEVAADGLTSVLNAYGDAVASASDVTDTLFVGIRAGKTTADELAASLGKVAPVAAAANVPFTELVASIAALTKGGISTKESVTGVRAVLASIVKPTQQASDAAARLGIDFTVAGLQSKGLAGFLEDVVEKTGGSSDELAQLFTGVEALVPVLALAGGAGEDFVEILAQMEERGGSTEEAFRKIANSPGFQLNRVFSSINAEFTKTVDGLLTSLVPAIRFLADNMNTLFDIAQVVGVFFGVTFAGRYIPIAIKALFSFAAAAKTAFLANPITAIAAAVTGLAALFVSQSDKIRLSAESSATALDLINEVLSRILEVGKLAFEGLASLLTGFQVDVDTLDISSFVTDFGRGVDLVRGYFAGAFAAVETIVTNTLARLSTEITNFFNGFSKSGNDFLTGLNVISRTIQGQTIDASVVSNALPTFEPVFKSTGKTAGEAYTEAFEQAIRQGFGQSFSRSILEGAEARAAAREAALKAAGAVTSTTTTDDGSGGGVSGAVPGLDARTKALADFVRALEQEGEALKLTGLDREVFLGQLSAEEKLRSALSDSNLKLSDTQIEALSKLTDAEKERIATLIRANATLAEQEKFDKSRNALVAQTIRNLESESTALQLTGREREAFGQILSIEENLRNQLRESSLNLTEEEINALSRLSDAERDRITQLITTNQLLATQAQVLEGIRGPARAAEEELNALNALYASGKISLQEYTIALREAQLEQVNLRVAAGDGTFADGFVLALDRMVGRVRSFSSEAGSIFGSFFEQVGNGFADTIGKAIFDTDNLGESLKSLARDAISGLVSSLVKLGLQFVANQILAQTLGAVATGATVAQAAAASAAWAPAAAAASLATLGANAAPAAAGITTTFALTKALAAAGSGFREGADFITGAGSSQSDSVLAALSVGEGIVNARANRRNSGVVGFMNAGGTVEPAGARPMVMNFNFPPGTDVDGFKRSQRQIERRAQAFREDNA